MSTSPHHWRKCITTSCSFFHEMEHGIKEILLGQQANSRKQVHGQGGCDLGSALQSLGGLRWYEARLQYKKRTRMDEAI